MVLRLCIEDVTADYLTRNCMIADAKSLSALVDSLRDYGQRSPIEVEELPETRYGLISGRRSLQALKLLA